MHVLRSLSDFCFFIVALVGEAGTLLSAFGHHQIESWHCQHVMQQCYAQRFLHDWDEQRRGETLHVHVRWMACSGFG
jgi:hypothetical protein